MKTAALGMACLVVLGAGCTFPSSKRIVTQQQANQVARVEYGTVEKVNAVVIAGDRGPIGLWGGAAAGAAVTDTAGHSPGRDLAQVGGAVAGAVGGQAVEEVATRKDAREMVIRLENGGLIVVTQAGAGFAVGERVAIANGPGGAQVMAP